MKKITLQHWALSYHHLYDFNYHNIACCYYYYYTVCDMGILMSTVFLLLELTWIYNFLRWLTVFFYQWKIIKNYQNCKFHDKHIYTQKTLITQSFYFLSKQLIQNFYSFLLNNASTNEHNKWLDNYQTYQIVYRKCPQWKHKEINVKKWLNCLMKLSCNETSEREKYRNLHNFPPYYNQQSIWSMLSLD